jgi:hypothetical protein
MTAFGFGKTINTVLLSMILIGCTSTIPSETSLMRQSENVNISAYELRDRLNVFATRFSNSIERAADQIISQTTDPEIKENALLWKMNAIPAANQALFLSDPLAALIDISALIMQMEYFFDHGKGSLLFGKSQSIAVQTAQALKGELLEIWTHARGGVAVDSVEILTSPITVWAEKYPIEDISFLRRSVSDTLFSQLNPKSLGLQETVGSIAVSAYDIRERLTIYTDQIPKQARWQAEYLIDKKLNDEQLKRSFDNFERISKSIDRMARIIEQSPDLADRLQYSTMARLTAERMAVMEALSKERMAVLDDFQRQRLAAMKDVENLTQNILSESETMVESLINHFYWRLLQILVLIYIVSLITFIVLKKTFWPGKRST